MSGLVLCTICARGGSKGVPGKNTRLVGGKPLIAHSIEQALASGLFSEIAVSSDSTEILETARQAGATLLIERPAELATDTAGKLPAIKHCALEAERRSNKYFDVVIDLDTTSPLRDPDDIRGAYQMLIDDNADNVITGAPARRSPYFNLVELDSAGHAHLSKPGDRQVMSRQTSPRCYDMNASVYVWRRAALLANDSVFLARTRLYEMPEERSIDIDTPLDLLLVEFLLAQRQGST